MITIIKNQFKIGDYKIKILEKKCNSSKLISYKNCVRSRGKLLSISYFSLLMAILFGLFQELYDSTLDEKYSIDFWSITHTLFCISLTLMIFLLTNKKLLSIIITFLFTTLFEPFELYLLSENGVLGNFSNETLGNRLMDLLFNVIGILIAYIIIIKKPIQN